MWYDPYTARASKEGCAACGTRTTNCYVLDFSFFPRKLVCKRHRDLHRSVLICRPGYEADGDLEILVAGASVAIAKKGINVEQGLACLLCGQSFVPIKALYGFLSSSLWMSGSRIESLPLACFCPECTARLTIEFMHKVPKR